MVDFRYLQTGLDGLANAHRANTMAGHLGAAVVAGFYFSGLARQGLAAHHRHLRLWRSLPDVEGELDALVKAEHDPRTAAYWETEKDSEQWSAHLTHRIKTLYGFFTLMRMIEDPKKRQEAEAAFGFLMA